MRVPPSGMKSPSVSVIIIFASVGSVTVGVKDSESVIASPTVSPLRRSVASVISSTSSAGVKT